MDRFTRLEGRIDKIDDRLHGVEINLATLNERVAHLPSKGFMVVGLITAVAVVSGAIGLSERARWGRFLTVFQFRSLACPPYPSMVP